MNGHGVFSVAHGESLVEASSRWHLRLHDLAGSGSSESLIPSERGAYFTRLLLDGPLVRGLVSYKDYTALSTVNLETGTVWNAENISGCLAQSGTMLFSFEKQDEDSYSLRCFRLNGSSPPVLTGETAVANSQITGTNAAYTVDPKHRYFPMAVSGDRVFIAAQSVKDDGQDTGEQISRLLVFQVNDPYRPVLVKSSKIDDMPLITAMTTSGPYLVLGGGILQRYSNVQNLSDPLTSTENVWIPYLTNPKVGVYSLTY